MLKQAVVVENKGATGSVVVDLIRASTGIQFVSVPYRGSSPVLVDLIQLAKELDIKPLD